MCARRGAENPHKIILCDELLEVIVEVWPGLESCFKEFSESMTHPLCNKRRRILTGNAAGVDSKSKLMAGRDQAIGIRFPAACCITTGI